MSDTLEAILKVHNYLNSVSKVQLALKKTESPLRMGVLSAAAINPVALFDPISTHPDVIVAGLAARSREKAQAQVSKYNLEGTAKVYDSYDDLVDDPTIDAVYIPLPNGLHTEWAIKSLEKGKHVLIEKPIANNVEEIDRIIDAARKARKVVLEAYHWRFHPACHLMRSLVRDHERYGQVESVRTKFILPGGMLNENDIRFDYNLGGGSCMDLCYVFSASCLFATGGEAADYSRAKIDVKSATPGLSKRDDRIDENMRAQFTVRLPGTETSPGERQIECDVEAALTSPKFLGFIPRFWMFPVVTVELTKATIELPLFVAPWAYHNVTIKEKDDKGRLTGKNTSHKQYVGGSEWAKVKNVSTTKGSDDEEIGENWWTTWRYQLEVFVNQVRNVDAGGNVDDEVAGPWVTMEESRKLMEVIEKVYEKAGMPKRGAT